MTSTSPIDYAYQDAKQMAFFLAQPDAFKPIYDEIARRRGFPFTIGRHVLFGLGNGAKRSAVALLAFTQQAARLSTLTDMPATERQRYCRAYWLMLATRAEDLLNEPDDLSRCRKNLGALLPVAHRIGRQLGLASFDDDAAGLLVERLKVRRDTDFGHLLRRLNAIFWQVALRDDDERQRIRTSLESAWPTLTEPMPAFRPMPERAA